MTNKERDKIVASIRAELKEAVTSMKAKDFGSAEMELEDVEYLVHALKNICHIEEAIQSKRSSL